MVNKILTERYICGLISANCTEKLVTLRQLSVSSFQMKNGRKLLKILQILPKETIMGAYCETLTLKVVD